MPRGPVHRRRTANRAGRSRAPRCSPPAARARCFRETTNPEVATGDGVALAYRAGARVADWSSCSFIRPCSTSKMRRDFCLSEALRGEGARLVDATGEPFMLHYHPAGDLAPRDVVARSIVLQSQRTAGPIYLSLRHLDAGRRASAISDDRRDVPEGRSRSRARSPSGRAGGALHDGWRRNRSRRPDVGAGSVCRRRGGVHARAWGQSPGQQFAARGAGLRRARGPGDGGSAA